MHIGKGWKLPKPSKREPEAIELHGDDIPKGLSFNGTVAVDTETQGLNLGRDRLCVVQLSGGDGVCHLVQIRDGMYDAPNLKALMADTAITKIFHFARFDVAILKRYLNVNVSPIFCTKIASKLVRTYTDRHGLKDITRELLNIELSKEQQSSDWANEKLSDDQLKYAAADVLNLHDIHRKLQAMLIREGRLELAQACFDFLPTRAQLDLDGWDDVDVFAHS